VSADTEGAVAASWPWAESLDALVAAANYHRLLFENERVRVLEVRIGPGQLVPVRTDRWPSAVYVGSAGDFVRRDGEGKLLFDSRTEGPPPPTPTVQWTEALRPHSVENIGNSEIHLIATELKEPANIRSVPL
jgi:hypothetical protein